MSLLVWLPLLGNLNNQGIHTGKIENMGAVSSNSSGKIGSCMSFNGTGTSNIRLPPILKNTDDMSFACWVKFNNTNNQCLFSQRVNTNTLGFTVFYLNGTEIRFDDGNALTASNSVSANTWYHIVCCRDAKKKYIYINGVLKATGTRTSTIASNVNSNYAFIGGSQNNTAGTPVQTNANMLNGYLNDVRIYNHCLSAAEVHEISQGLVLHYKLDSITNNNLIKLTPKSYNSGSYTAYQLNLTENLVSGQTYTFQFWDVNVSHTGKTAANLGISVYWGGGSVALKTMNGTSYFTDGHADYLTFTITITSSQASGSGATNAWLNIYNSVSNASGTKSLSIGAWKCEKGSVATPWDISISEGGTLKIMDNSGYNNNGTIFNNLSLSSNTPRYSCSTVFEKSKSQCICGGRGALVTDALTASFWLYMADWSTMTRDMRTITTANSCGWYLDPYTADRLYVWVNVGPTTNNNNKRQMMTNVDYTKLSAGWHHMAITYDQQTISYYLDGVLDKSTTWDTKKTIYYTSSTALFLGAKIKNATQPNGGYFDGGMSDVRIYCTPLSADDIKQLYELGAKVDNKHNWHTFEFKEENVIPKILKQGITKVSEIYEARTIPISATSFSYKPAANTSNSTSNGINIDLSEFANQNKSITLTLEYDIAWSNLAAGTGGTFKTWLQGPNRKIADNAWAWAGSNYFTGDVFTSLVGSGTGSVHRSRTITIPATWFNTYNGSRLGGRTDYSNGNGTITVSNIKITMASSAKIINDKITSNNLIEF